MTMFSNTKALKAEISALSNELSALKGQLQSEIARRERAELDLDRQRDDFNALVRLTAGRVPPKQIPEFNKDIWKDDDSLPEVFLSPDEDEFFVPEVATTDD